MSWLSRAGARLLPAERRDWAEAVWAEAPEVPGYWPRLAWRAGGVWLIAREAQMVRRIGTLLLFTAAAGAAAWSAWPGSAVSDAATARACVIATVLLLAGLPLLSRWLLGPPGNRMARWLRAGCYAAILAIMPAIAVTRLFLGAVPRGGHDLHTFHFFQGPGVPGAATAGPAKVALLVIAACGLAVILALTARRTPVAPATLAIGAGLGLVLGVVMYAVDPLGVNKYVTAPWLRGTMTDTVPAGQAQYLVALAWILLVGAPVAAGLLAGRRCHVPGSPEQVSAARAWQGAASGLVANSVGALFVTVLGTGTTALLVKWAWARDLLYRGQHLTASAVYGRELFASQNVPRYGLICLAFPVIGALMGLVGAGVANGLASPRPDGGHPPGPPRPEPLPDRPDGRRLADAGADRDMLPSLYDDGDGGLVGAGLGLASAAPAAAIHHHRDRADPGDHSSALIYTNHSSRSTGHALGVSTLERSISWPPA
jgi:hypothetical protein